LCHPPPKTTTFEGVLGANRPLFIDKIFVSIIPYFILVGLMPGFNYHRELPKVAIFF